MQVRDIMSSPVVTVDADSSLRDAASRLLDDDIGSVVVTRDGPAGIVTESDVLHSAYTTDRPLSELPVTAAMSRPIQTVRPGASIRTVSDRMRSYEVKKLVVVDGIEVRGIVTLTDLVWHLSEITSEARRVGEARHDWASR